MSKQKFILSTFFRKTSIKQFLFLVLTISLTILPFFNSTNLRVQSQQADFTLENKTVLIPFERITFSPQRSAPEIFGDQDMTISVNTAGSNFNYIQNGAICLIQARIQDAVNKNGTLTNQWTNLYQGTYSSTTGCSGTLSKNNQLAPWFSLKVKIVNPSTGMYPNMSFGTEFDYAFLYGAVGIVEIIGQDV